MAAFDRVALAYGGLARRLLMVGMNKGRLKWPGGLLMVAAVVAFGAYIAVAGVSKASELAGVVSALVAIAGLGLAAYGIIAGRAESDEIGHPIIQSVTSEEPPWTLKGYGVTYQVVKVTRTTSNSGFEPRRSITVHANVTRTERNEYSPLEIRFEDEGSGSMLEPDPFEGSDEIDPPLSKSVRLVTVLFDVDPPAASLTITVNDFFWPDGRRLILEGVRVPPVR